jgi:UDP-2-acetamido-2-deoxy-ribo-hexuluronate aminotransferase
MFYHHETAIVDAGAQIGDGSRIWHFVHVCGGARIGRDCSLGQNVFVGNRVVIGNNVKIQNNVSVYDNVVLEDDVFCGPSMVFTNVYNPRSAVSRKDEYRDTVVQRGATLGANCTIVCRVTIGEYAFVAAGAVINRDVRPYALMAGVPARHIGWISRHGERLDLPLDGDGVATCPATGVKHCLTVASGTDSLEIALRALGIGPGDEVITVPFTWISSAEVIGLVGATPVFVDIEPASFNINVDFIEAAITPRTKAILPVSLFGQMPDYAAINAVAGRHGLTVIEDGAQSFGATQQGRRSCGVTTIGSTSFFPAKPLGCYGDGGALFTDDDELAERMRAIRTHGGIRRHHHPLLGMNGRFDTLQAAILLAKWPYFAGEVEARGRIGARYSEQLKDCCITPQVMPGNTHVYAQYTVRLAERVRVSEVLKAQGIPTAVYYPKCLHEQPVFAGLGYRWGDFPEAERASWEVLSLPMHPWLTEQEQDRVISAIQTVIDEDFSSQRLNLREYRAIDFSTD